LNYSNLNMKNIHLIVSIAIITLLQFSCGMRSTTLMVEHPGDIHLPSDLDTLIIIDRTVKSKENGKKVGNILEAIITSEPIGGDTRGKNALFERLVMDLKMNERIDLATYEIIRLENSDAFNSPKAIPAEVMDSICKLYGADGAISLDLFDSDNIAPGLNPNSIDPETVINTRWKLYYAEGQEIVDSYEMSFKPAKSGGLVAVKGLPTNYKTIVNGGKESAERYVKHITPYKYNEARSYYIGGSKLLRDGASWIKLTDYDQAKDVFHRIVDTGVREKEVRKAAFNLALMYEIEGDYDTAIRYAEQSAQAGDSHAGRYLRILKTIQKEMPLIELQKERS
jgi:tetratricopeptide (TPR) repeat protein